MRFPEEFFCDLNALKSFCRGGLLPVLVVLVANQVSAEVYSCTAKNGTIVLSNQESDKKKSSCKKMDLPKSDSHKTAQKPVQPQPQPVNSPDAGEPAAAQQPVLPPKSRERETVRKKIIRSEIEAENKRLELVRSKMDDLNKRNVPGNRKQDELAELKRQEANHEKNIKQLNVELSR